MKTLEEKRRMKKKKMMKRRRKKKKRNIKAEYDHGSDPYNATAVRTVRASSNSFQPYMLPSLGLLSSY